MSNTVSVLTRSGRREQIDLNEFKNAKYGDFTKFIRTKYDSLYGIDDKEIHKVRVEIYGTKTVKYSTELDVYVSDESQIYDAINNEVGYDTRWENEDDYDDIEWDGEYYVESIDDGAYKLVKDKDGNECICKNKYDPKQMCFNF